MTYHHRQSGAIGPLLFAISTSTAAATALLANEPGIWTLAAVSLIFAILSASFWYLEISLSDTWLTVSFGPLRVARFQRPIHTITAAVPESSDWLDGWGIHRLPGRSVIWNLHGFDCVRVTFQDGREIRLGTDEPKKLAIALTKHLT